MRIHARSRKAVAREHAYMRACKKNKTTAEDSHRLKVLQIDTEVRERATLGPLGVVGRARAGEVVDDRRGVSLLADEDICVHDVPGPEPYIPLGR